MIMKVDYLQEVLIRPYKLESVKMQNNAKTGKL